MQTPFIKKIKKIMEDPQNEDIICWNSNKSVIEIRNEKMFEQKILNKNFRHNKISSFIRQLNLYGFKKIRSMEFQTFTHPMLEKGLGLEAISSQKRKNDKNEDITIEEDRLNFEESMEKLQKQKNGISRKETKDNFQNSQSSFLKKANEPGKNELSHSSKISNNDFMNSFWVFPIQQSTWPMSYISYKDNAFLNYSPNTVINWC